MTNLFDLSGKETGKELFSTLFEQEGILIERIVSCGETTDWYDQEVDEWLVLIEGEAVLEYENRGQQKLTRGDTLYLPARQKHRVIFTSTKPPCVWLAVFFSPKS
jgi:cupin 2 domain-containing protein